MRRPLVIAALAMLVAIGVALPRAGETRAAAPDPRSSSSSARRTARRPSTASGPTSSRPRRRSTPRTSSKVYSPYATWSAVKAALQGANIVVYLGHGNGFPNPYRSVALAVQRRWLRAQRRRRPGRLQHQVLRRVLRRQRGQARPQRGRHPQPPVLRLRQSRAGQSRGDAVGGPSADRQLRRRVHQGRGGRRRRGGQIRRRVVDQDAVHDPPDDGAGVPLEPGRERPCRDVPVDSDPRRHCVLRSDTTSGGYYRSMVGRPDLNTADVTGAPASDTGSDPSDFVVPGSASVGTGGATIFGGADLTAESTTLAAGTKLRVLASAATTMLAGSSGSGRWTAPRPATQPRRTSSHETASGRWSGDCRTSRCSRPTVTASATSCRSARTSARPSTGRSRSATTTARSSGRRPAAGPTLAADWMGLTAGAAAPEGVYDLAVSGDDEWGNGPVERTSQVLLDRHPGDRLAGADRYATAAAISKATFAPGVGLVYVATGANFPDALAGAAAAGKTGSPVLLVGATSILVGDRDGAQPTQARPDRRPRRLGRRVRRRRDGAQGLYDRDRHAPGWTRPLRHLRRHQRRIVRSWGRRRLRRDRRQLPRRPRRGCRGGDERCAGPPRQHRVDPRRRPRRSSADSSPAGSSSSAAPGPSRRAC